MKTKTIELVALADLVEKYPEKKFGGFACQRRYRRLERPARFIGTQGNETDIYVIDLGWSIDGSWEDATPDNCSDNRIALANAANYCLNNP